MKKRTLGFFVIFLVMGHDVQPEAFQEGKAFVEGNSNMDLIDSTGLPVNENPEETKYNDETKIGAAIEQEKQTNEAFNQIKEANEKRESFEIDVDIPELDELSQEAGAAVDDEMGGSNSTTLGENGTVLKICRKSGEPYTMTCRRQRMIEIRVTPEVIGTHPKTCPGHWREGYWSGSNNNEIWRHGGNEYCYPGCTHGGHYVAQEKIIEFPRDDWVGCEDLDHLHDLGQAEIVSEELGPLNETRMIDGEPVTRDYWETTRTYAFNSNKVDGCEPLRALGCVQQDSICEEYATGMAGVRICKRFKMTYACKAASETRISNRSKLDLTLPPPQTSIANQNMYNALSQMEAMRQIAKHMEGGSAADLKIFRGENKSCTTNFGGSFKDCCKSNGGVGTRMHLATDCSAGEKQLAEAKAQDRCVFVGSRKKNSTLGMNISKEYIYCCYPTKLGLAIQKGARAQLGKDFGSVDDPHCEGLTPDELSRVDFSQLDLSATFADITASATKMSREVAVDLSQKQRQFDKPAELASIKANQPKHKRVNAQGETNEIVY
jgi:conjugal transfer mating pair stabilization protein TraN